MDLDILAKYLLVSRMAVAAKRINLMMFTTEALSTVYEKEKVSKVWRVGTYMKVILFRINEMDMEF